MKHSYLLAGIKINQFIRLVRKNGVSPRYLFRFLFLFQGGVWSSLLSYLEKRKYKSLLEDLKLPDDPIFIIGHWRTGSTFLHQLMNLHDQLIAPSVFQVSVPDNFLISRRYYEPVMTKMIDAIRPMDQVKLGFNEPQEDEYAILKMGVNTPLRKLVFPSTPGYFLSDTDSFAPGESEINDWKQSFSLFTRKLTFQSGKRIVFKNPFHSMRIERLHEMFPNAYFIHIYRNPYLVIPSTIRMWRIVGKQNCLKKYQSDPPMTEVIEVYKRIAETIRRTTAKLPSNQYSEVKFEEFESDPVSLLRVLCSRIGLPFTSEYEKKIRDFLEEVKDYRKNQYILLPEQKDLITEQLNDELERYGYVY